MSMRKLINVFIALLISCTCISNTFPYTFRYATELPIIGYSIANLGIGYGLHQNLQKLTSNDIEQLSRNDVPKFDRFAIDKYSTGTANTSVYFSVGSILTSIGSVGLISLLNSNTPKTFIKQSTLFAGLYIETFITTYSTLYLAKNAVHRIRPFVYNENIGLNEKQEIDAQMSFFSRHTSITAASTFFAASVISQYTDLKWVKCITWTSAAILPAMAGVMRIESGRHFPTDIIAGYAIGTLCGIGIPWLHKAKDNNTITGYISPQNAEIIIRL